MWGLELIEVLEFKVSGSIECEVLCSEFASVALQAGYTVFWRRLYLLLALAFGGLGLMCFRGVPMFRRPRGQSVWDEHGGLSCMEHWGICILSGA